MSVFNLAVKDRIFKDGLSYGWIGKMKRTISRIMSNN